MLVKQNIKKHEDTCYLNPINKIQCVVCTKSIKNYKSSKGTCSRSCANTHFRTGSNNGNWNPDRYPTTCWEYHKKECIVCKEDKIVAVHHYDENHNNNSVDNLVPLCPTHHQYMHSRYRHLIEKIVNKYVEDFKNGV